MADKCMSFAIIIMIIGLVLLLGGGISTSPTVGGIGGIMMIVSFAIVFTVYLIEELETLLR